MVHDEPGIHRRATYLVTLALGLAGCSQPGKTGGETGVVSVDPAPYASGCVQHGDCVPVASQFLCQFGVDSCWDAAITRNSLDDYQREMNRARDRCAAPLEPANSIDCFLESEPGAVCVAGVCEFRPHVGCFDAADCVARWGSDPATVECVDFVGCRECMDGVNYEPGGCDDGSYCLGEACIEFEPCATAADCGLDRYNGTILGCRDGLCRPCGADAECSGLPSPPAICVPGGSVVPAGCWLERDVDERCLLGTCPTPCEKPANRWVCREP